ncbi:MAG: SMC family ATPase [Actinomycetota bacterium]
MRPLALNLEGFLSYREPTAVAFDQVGAAVILGDNGAGKTSLIEAMVWALYGAGRGRGPDEYVSVGTSLARVSLTFSLGTSSYRVTRERTLAATSRSSLELVVRAATVEAARGVGDWLPVGGDSIAETQAAITELLGMDAETWTSTSFIGQGRADAFTQLRPAARKTLLAEVLGLGRYEALGELARALEHELVGQHAAALRRTDEIESRQAEDLEPVEQILDAALTRRARARALLEVQERELAEASAAVATALEGLAGVEQIQHRLTDLRGRRLEEVERRERELGRCQREERQSEGEISEQRVTVDRLRPAEAQAQQFDDQAARHQGERDAARENAARHQGAAAELEKRSAAEAQMDHGAEDVARKTRERIDRLARTTEPVCDQCGQDLPSELRDKVVRDATAFGKQMVESAREHAELARTLLEEAAKNTDAARADDREAETLERKIADLTRAADKARVDAGRIGEEQDRLAALHDRQKQVRDALAAAEAAADSDEALRPLDDQIAELEQQLARVADQEAALLGMRDEESKRAELVRHARGDLEEAIARVSRAEALVEETERLRAEHGQLVAQLGDLDVRRNRYATLSRAFGRDGIPSLIVENAVPEIEATANRLLEQLTEGRIQVRIDSLRAKKDGGLKETLDVTVSDETSERALETWSGGERQAVDLALRVGLSRLLAHRAGRQISTLILDEAFTAFDAGRRQRAVEVIHALQEEFPTVLLVTHLPELADAFPTRFEVSRENGSSHVEVVHR